MNHKKLSKSPSSKQAPSPSEQSDKPARQERAPDAKDAVRTLAAFYLGYLVYQLIKEISSGHVSDGSMPWILAAIALFCVGIVWLIWPEVKRIKEVLDADDSR